MFDPKNNLQILFQPRSTLIIPRPKRNVITSGTGATALPRQATVTLQTGSNTKHTVVVDAIESDGRPFDFDGLDMK